VSLEYTGTATGTDYVASSVTIPAGDLTRTVTIDPTADLIYEEKPLLLQLHLAVEMELLLELLILQQLP
jgi:hypothetical protein